MKLSRTFFRYSTFTSSSAGGCCRWNRGVVGGVRFNSGVENARPPPLVLALALGVDGVLLLLLLALPLPLGPPCGCGELLCERGKLGADGEGSGDDCFWSLRTSSCSVCEQERDHVSMQETYMSHTHKLGWRTASTLFMVRI